MNEFLRSWVPDTHKETLTGRQFFTVAFLMWLMMVIEWFVFYGLLKIIG